MVYVGDQVLGALFAIDAATGQRRWSSRDLRDSAFRSIGPLPLAARRTGGVIATDESGRSLLFVGAEGKLEHRIDLPPGEPISGLCDLPGSQLLVNDGSTSEGPLRLTYGARVLGRAALSWPDLRRMSSLLTHLSFSATASGCVGALLYGRGFAEFVGDRFGPPMSYVEPAPLPRVERTVRTTDNGYVISNAVTEHSGAGLSIATTPDRLLIVFGGHSEARRHVVDSYTLDGHYLSSFRTRHAITSIAANDRMLFLLTHDKGYPVVIALRQPSSPGDAPGAR